MTAVTMSLVLGMYGSAMAENYYGTSSNNWSTDEKNAVPHGFTGEWNNNSDADHGEAHRIYGGYVDIERYEASVNSVKISNCSIDAFVTGGLSVQGNANRNTVSLTGNGTKVSALRGGVGWLDARYNTVVLNPNTQAGLVYGGISLSGGRNADYNTVKLDTAEALSVTGGLGEIVRYNTVELKNSTVSQHVAGGDSNYDGSIWEKREKSAHNTLKLIGSNTVGNISYFQNLEFYLDENVTNGSNILTITSFANENTNLDNFESIKIFSQNGTKLKIGDKVNLINKKGTTSLTITDYREDSIFDSNDKVKDKIVAYTGPLSAVIAELSLANIDGDAKNDLVLTVLENSNPKENPILADQIKSHVETRVNAAVLLNEGADFMMDQGMASAKAAAKDGGREMTPFVAVGSGNMRYKTGSHIDSKSWHVGGGVSKQVGDLMFGIAVEHGKNNYDSYVNEAHGEGKGKSIGGTVFAEIKKDNGVHYDLALRTGRIKNTYSANLLGGYSNYDESSTYYGMSIGGGKEFALNDKDKVDVYGRYYWAHTNSSDVTIAGDKLNFDAVNSHRTRLGSRYTHTVNDMSKLYAGLAWQYEFSGEAKATVNGDAAPAPSLKGHSGMLELGWKVEASKNIAIDLNMSGWTGKQRGIMGGVNMQWKF